ncbi:MAG: amidase [Alphaproteobacteria bacterium]|nr:amidase [Alphaproteobacteria bacterium]
MEPAFLSATQLAKQLRDRKLGARELLEHFLKRIARYNPRLNAVIGLDVERARRRANLADKLLMKGGELGPLHGVPMTVKESFDLEGLPTTWGDPSQVGNVAKTDSLAVKRFRAAGAVVFGKTNVPLMLADWQSFNAVYGSTNNPWDLTRSPGGSSGGSAAALAAGLTGFEAGSDIGASIRNPAHYCGVYGLKPTWGICPPTGHALGGRVAMGDISAIGPLGRSAKDLELGLDIMAGPDEIEGAGWVLALPPPRHKRAGEYRIAVMLEDRNAEVDRPVQDAIRKVAEHFAREGAKVSFTARPAIDTDMAQKVYIALLRAATSGRQSDAELRASIEAERQLAGGDESYRARMVRANVMRHRDWLAFNETRHRMRLAWAAFFREWDAVLMPAASSAAVPHDQKGERWQRQITVNNKRVPTTDQLFWAGYPGMALLPGAVAPVGLSPEGLPIGVQIVCAQYHDRTAIHLARLIERDYQGFVPPPGYD